MWKSLILLQISAFFGRILWYNALMNICTCNAESGDKFCSVHSIEPMRQYSAKLIQDGIEVAGVSGPDKEAVQREIVHYAMMYGQDGPVTIKENFHLDSEEHGRA